MTKRSLGIANSGGLILEFRSFERLEEKESWPKRKAYFGCLEWRDKRPIVALTGLRRTGKSTILRQIKAELPTTGEILPRQFAPNFELVF